MLHAYPQKLAEFIRDRWAELVLVDKPGAASTLCTLPSKETLETLLSTAYQATLLREEERPVTFRIILGSPASFPTDAGPPDGFHRLMFTRKRPFTEHELRRLSPAAKYHRSLIGVDQQGEELFIWGILQSGPRWLDSVRGGRRSTPALPSTRFVIRAAGPGRLAVASGSRALGEIRGGKMTAPGMDAFESSWLPALFRQEREELVQLYERMRAQASGWAELDQDVLQLLPQQMVKRTISTIRSAHHGGTLIVVPPERAVETISQFIRLKYAFEDTEPRQRFRSLMVEVMRTLARNPDGRDVQSGKVGWSAYASSTSETLISLDEAVFELSNTVAALADVDGAVVMTKRFEILGFGGEIAGELPDVRTVRRALDLDGTETEEESVEALGTRHRSAYRFISRMHDALAIVISQDGSAHFIAWYDGAVTYWDHVSIGSPEG